MAVQVFGDPGVVRERGGIPLRDYTQTRQPDLFESSLEQTERPPTGLRKIEFEKVARVLGWFSLGLGLVQLLRPRQIQEMVGVGGDHTRVVRAVGLREFIHAFLIFIPARPRVGMWTRVAGGIMDLALLGSAFSSRTSEKKRLKTTILTLAGVGALDVLTAVQLTRQRAAEKRHGELTPEGVIRPARRDRSFHVVKSVTVNQEPGVVYPFWRNLENLPRFMFHLKDVRILDERRSHWVANAPAGRRVEWEAEITEDVPNEKLAWQSLPGADVTNTGIVRFEPGPSGRGTVVHVEIEYRPPGGAIGRVIAKLFGEAPEQQVAGDLRRFKQVMETGEVLLSESSPRGFGQKRQRPAQPRPGSFAAARSQLSFEKQRKNRLDT